MNRTIVVVLTCLLMAVPAMGTDFSAVAASNDCLPFDTKCIEDQSDCDYWDPLCKDDLDECPSWNSSCNKTNGTTSLTRQSQPEQIEYVVEVNCSLVLKETIGGISGYCDNPSRADLGHCINAGSSYGDKYSVDFLCSDGRPPMMAKASSNEVSVRNLGGGFSFTEPFWIICDEGMGGFTTNKRCYDSEYSDGDDWKSGCKIDNRLSAVYESGERLRWYACS